MKEVFKIFDNRPLMATLFFGYVLCPIFSENSYSIFYRIFLYYPFIILCWFSIYKLIKNIIDSYFKENQHLFVINLNIKDDIKSLSDKITDNIYVLLIVAFSFYFIIFSQVK